MAVLTITTADLKRLCSLTGSDDDDAIAALIAAEQPVWEYALDPAVLAAAPGEAGLLATLTLGVAEALAGSYLAQVGRAVGYTDDFTLGGLHVTASRTETLGQIGGRLAAQGAGRLKPYLRAGQRVALDAVGDVPDSSTRAPLSITRPVAASVFDTYGNGDGNA